MTLNNKTFNQLIQENLVWLLKQERTLERDHIELILKQSIKPERDYYQDERYCKYCEEYTQHKCKDSGHERDSSGDWKECLVCHCE